MADEYVVLVDEDDTQIGTEEKWTAHENGQLHRAISVFILNDSDEVLLQRRIGSKPTFGGLWANTCCTHPRPGEATLETANRRLTEETGLTADLTEVGSFIYRATDPNTGYTEHELDHVFVGRGNDDPTLDPTEADAFLWKDIDSLREAVESDVGYVPWLKPALALIPDDYR